MNILIGVLQKEENEYLVVLKEGKACLVASESETTGKEYLNYQILKEHNLLIKGEPVSGYGVFRFRYGPVTSGLREAGSFSLYTYGEKILHTTIDLNWKHRQMEQSMTGQKPDDAVKLSEKVCSNFAVSHSVACSLALENALGIRANTLVRNWRTLLMEAERVYNHLHVIYKLASAAAQKVLASHLGALFEESLRINKALSGSRYLMGINQINHINNLPALDTIRKTIKDYQGIIFQFEKLYKHSLSNPNFLDRLHHAGMLSREQASSLGLSGPSLRACGLEDNLNGATGEHLIALPVVTQQEGDALARMETRAEELVNSCQYLIDHLKVSDIWEGYNVADMAVKPEGEGLGISHSPSGAVGYYVVIKNNRVSYLRMFTPSYPGMHAVSEALKDQVFTDFPFVYDSFGVHFTDAAC